MSGRNEGFTLVELAIVLMIIGLLIGGILKGQELITNARITSALAQLKSYDAAALTFMDAYGGKPGDITNPATRLPNCSANMCNIAGDGDGRINSSEEYGNFWIHLAAANLISGININHTWTPGDFYTGALPVFKLGGNVALRYRNVAPDASYPQGTVGHYYLPSANLADGSNNYAVTTMTQIARMDVKADDGKPCHGDMIAREYCAANNGAMAYPVDNTVQFIIVKTPF